MQQTDFKYYTLKDYVNNENLNQRSETDERFKIPHSFKSITLSFATIRGIEWSLRALASMRAVCLFLRARAVIKYVLRAASILKNS